MAQSVRERTSEIGVLKTMGFSNPAILLFMLGESTTCGARRRARSAGGMAVRTAGATSRALVICSGADSEMTRAPIGGDTRFRSSWRSSIRARASSLSVTGSNPRVNVEVQREAEYYAEKSQALSGLIRGLGFAIAALMGIGAVFGTILTMYTAVSTRSREIATCVR